MKNPRDVLGKVGVVGAGGGFRGACLSGFLEPLIRRGVPIDYLEGVSVSTLVFSKLSEAQGQDELLGKLEHINSVWDWIERNGPKVVFPFSAGGVWSGIKHGHFLKDHKPLFKLIGDFQPEKSITGIQFDFLARDTKSMEHKRFSNRDPLFRSNPELLTRAIVSSACLFPAFPSISVGSRDYHDGGFVTLDGAAAAGCDTVFVLLPYPDTYRPPRPAVNLIEKILPIIERFSAELAAALRDLDKSHIRRHQEIAELGEKYNRLLSAYEKALQELELKRAAEEAGGKGLRWLGKSVLRAISSIVKSDETQDAGFEKFRCMREVIMNGESPETMTTKEFIRGDIAEMRKRAIAATDKKLDELLR